MKHPRCESCEAFVRAWFHRHAPQGAKPGWKCIGCGMSWCDECAPQDGTGKHDEARCR